MKTKIVPLLSLLLLTTTALADAAKPVALIYHGPGACQEDDADCAATAAAVARKAGFTPHYVDGVLGEKSTDIPKLASLFAGAKVWIQPGGVANEAYDTMSDRLIESLRQFIQNGGGYVGFCAGAFMATHLIGGTGEEGLGIVPGSTDLYHAGMALERVNWLGKRRTIYFEGGPYFYGIKNNPKVQVTATYENGTAAAIRTNYGKGRVWVTGLHPEAPLNWTSDDDIVDPDGVEQNLAVDMIRWAGQLKPVKRSPPKTTRRHPN